jgi:hypothetical protein
MDYLSLSAQFPAGLLEKAALIFLLVVYTIRITWLHFRFNKGTERQPKTGHPSTTRAKGALYSLLIIALPWDMESFRTKPVRYLQFVFFHLAIAATIGLAFIIPYGPSLLGSEPFLWTLRIVLAFGALSGIMKIVRRFTDIVVRTVSNMDDHFSLIGCTAWIISALLMVTTGGITQSVSLQVFFYLLVILNFYAPFSKISHYIFYPFTRYWFGASMGYRGVYPLVRSQRPAPTADAKKTSP